MNDNPNPRGWRAGGLFVDLDEVLMITRQNDPGYTSLITKILFRGADDTYIVKMSDEQHISLLNAIEIYRSGR